jgi:hypothetical protein
MKKITITLFLFFSISPLFSQEIPPSIKDGKFNTNVAIKRELDSLSKTHSVHVIVYNVIEAKDSTFYEILYYDQYNTTRRKLLGTARKSSTPTSLSNHTNGIKFK